ncbi:MAG: hypothetical protein V3574_04105 [Candidatus Moraniibacteriota bacterium]
MADINLHKAAESDIRISRQKSIIKSGPFISLTLLIVVLSAYGITFATKQTSEKKRADLIIQRQTQLDSLDKVSMAEAVDFQYSIDNIAFNVNNKKNPNEVLEETVEKHMIKSSYLESLSYDGSENKLTLELVSESFRDSASQILSLKNSDKFKDIRVVDSNRNQDEEAVVKLDAFYLQ